MGLLPSPAGTSGLARTARALSLAALLLGLAFGLPASVAAHDGHCQVQVTPRAAAGGSAFRFTGTGFSPTTLTLQRAGGAETVHDLELDGEDWEFTVHSRIGDVGRWTAVFTAPDGCTATAKFVVTLTNTDAADAVPAGMTNAGRPASVAAWAFTLLVGLAGGLLIGSRVRSTNRA